MDRVVSDEERRLSSRPANPACRFAADWSLVTVASLPKGRLSQTLQEQDQIVDLLL